ncbi:MAG TPA: hypothetical protein VM434_09305 [Beijerinckiaceae bacterium]|nr:hypothetical protein [Beijerinckiaceae bacterium]
MFHLSGRVRPTLLFVTVKAAIATAVLSVFAVHWLSGAAEDRARLSQLAAQVSGVKDPLITGSLGEFRIDPCVDTRPR